MRLTRRLALAPRPREVMPPARWKLAVLLVLAGCATMRPLSEDTARARGVHRFEAGSDEAFDAVWLTLAAQGYAVTESARSSGTLTAARPDGHGYDVTVSAEDAWAVVSALPRTLWLGGPDDEDAKWQALWEGAAHLLDAWREPPEWRYLTRTNTLALEGFSFQPPQAWAYLDYDIHRRRARVLRRRGAPAGTLNPALLAVVQRRRPESSLPALLREAAGLALTARSRLTLPDELEARREGEGTVGGVARVLDGAVVRPLAWHAHRHRTAEWEVWVVAVCGAGAEACDAEWSALLASVKRGGGR